MGCAGRTCQCQQRGAERQLGKEQGEGRQGAGGAGGPTESRSFARLHRSPLSSCEGVLLLLQQVPGCAAYRQPALCSQGSGTLTPWDLPWGGWHGRTAPPVSSEGRGHRPHFIPSPPTVLPPGCSWLSFACSCSSPGGACVPWAHC